MKKIIFLTLLPIINISALEIQADQTYGCSDISNIQKIESLINNNENLEAKYLLQELVLNSDCQYFDIHSLENQNYIKNSDYYYILQDNETIITIPPEF